MTLLQQIEQHMGQSSSHYSSRTYAMKSSLFHSRLSSNAKRSFLNAVLTTSAVYCKPLSAKPAIPKAEALAIAAKKHSEAERRRRLRINSQFAALRTILPNLTKMDKASVLGETVWQVTQLKKMVKELESESCGKLMSLVPGEEDSLNLKYCNKDKTLVKVMFSCQDRLALISNITEALKSTKGKVVRAEMVIVGGRAKHVLWIQGFLGNEGIVRLKKTLKAIIDPPSLPGNNQKHRFSH